VPTTAHNLATHAAEPVPDKYNRTSSPFILDLPRLPVHKMGAAQTKVHLWVVAEVDHPACGVNGAAAPAGDITLIV